MLRLTLRRARSGYRRWRKTRENHGIIQQYVEQRDGGYWVADTRVSLDSIVYAFMEGQTAESIAQAFPVLSLEQTYGSIAFYLANRPAVDAYLAEARDDYEARRRAARSADPMFYRKLSSHSICLSLPPRTICYSFGL